MIKIHITIVAPEEQWPRARDRLMSLGIVEAMTEIGIDVDAFAIGYEMRDENPIDFLGRQSNRMPVGGGKL